MEKECENDSDFETILHLVEAFIFMRLITVTTDMLITVSTYTPLINRMITLHSVIANHAH